MGQTVLTCLTFKPPGPPPHEKLYGCGLYFAWFLPGKQSSRLLSLLQEKPGCLSCALGGQGRAFITELRQTSAGLGSHDQLITHCEFPGKAISRWEWGRELLLASTGWFPEHHGHTESPWPLSPHGPSCPACTEGPPGALQDTSRTLPKAETAPPTPRAPPWAFSTWIYSPALPQHSAMWSRVREPGHSGHNQTDFLWNVEEPGGWGMMKMVSKPRGCSCAWWIPTAPGIQELEARRWTSHRHFPQTYTDSVYIIASSSREINSNVEITLINDEKASLNQKCPCFNCALPMAGSLGRPHAAYTQCTAFTGGLCLKCSRGS